MIKATWVSAAAELYRAVTTPGKDTPLYQIQCVHNDALCLFLASSKCIVRIEHSKASDLTTATTAYQLTDPSTICNGNDGYIKSGFYEDASNPLKPLGNAVVEKVFIGLHRFCGKQPEYISASLFNTFDTVLTNNGRLFTIARKAGTANWMRCSNNLPNVLAAADCLEYFFQNDIKNNYDVGFVVCDNNMFVATFKHKTLPVTAWVPLIYFTSSIDLRFRLNGNNYQVTGFGDREKPYKYDELKGEQEMEANLTSLADLSKQLGLKENLNNVAAPATASIIPAAVVETVTPVIEPKQEAAPVPVVEEQQQPVEPEQQEQQEQQDQPKQRTALEMLQELAEEIDSLINLNNTLVKQWPKKVKAINKAFAAEAKARALDPKVAKRLEDLEADSAKLKKILSTLGM